MSEEELVTAGTVSDKVDDEKVALEKKQKNKRKRWLLEETKKANRRGVCYLSRVPPHMDPKKLRQTLSQYGELERVYLTPEDAESLVRRKKSGVFRGKEFSEGWVEFTDKRVAKRVASMLNGEQIGGRKRSSFYYDLWNIKYLSKFKWDDLTEEIAYKSATREQKLALELSAAKRERDFYLHKSDQSTAINKMAERLKKKLSKGGSSKDGGAEDKRRGKKNAKDFPSVPVDQYSGRLREIRGRERGPIPASTRARRSKLMANEELSSDDTENLIEDSYESPETIDTQTRNKLESEIPLQQGADDFRDDTSPEADNNFNTNSYRPSTHFNHPNSYQASPHLNDDVPPFNVSGYSQMSDHIKGEGGSGQLGEEAPNNATNQPWRELTQGIDGGPTNAELLTGFLGHIAHSIWMRNDRDILEGFHQNRKLSKFKDYLNDDVLNVVDNSHLSHLPSCMRPKINMPLISAFVERWHPETNSFHLPFGEMTITLHDVHYLLGIPVHGRAVKVEMNHPETLKLSLSTHMQLNDASLKANFKSTGFKRSTIEAVLKAQTLPPPSHAIMYLLWLIGTSLFVDKSGHRVPVGFLPFLHQLDEVHMYAWGAAALANQYRQLGIASRIGCKQIDGCLSLVQMWIYKHFPGFESWNLGTIDQDQTALHLAYRSALDNVPANEVIWTPYGRRAEEAVPISQFREIIHCLKITEAYMPDRVMRQFGYPQFIPQPLITPMLVQRPPQPSLYRCSYRAGDSFENFQKVRCNFHLQTLRVHYGTEALPAYQDWFRPRTHMQVIRQESFTRKKHYRPADMNPTVRIQWLGAKLAQITKPSRRYMSQKDVFDIVDEICEHFQDVITLRSQ